MKILIEINQIPSKIKDMDIVIIQEEISSFDYNKLADEFPQLLFLVFHHETYHKLSPTDWNRVEIIYGNQLKKEELNSAKQLKWIHTEGFNLNSICLDDINNKGNILITLTKGRDIVLLGECIASALLAFSKDLFYWITQKNNRQSLIDSFSTKPFTLLKGKRILQIGTGEIGSEILKRTKLLGMDTIGVDKQRSFHPYCRKTLHYKDIHSLLPSADVVSFSPSEKIRQDFFFSGKEFKLMKDQSIFLFTGTTKSLDIEALIHTAKEGKFKGIFCDFTDSQLTKKLPKESEIWKIPNLILFPGLANRSLDLRKKSLAIFRYNLRQFLSGNYLDMKNLYQMDITTKKMKVGADSDVIPT